MLQRRSSSRDKTRQRRTRDHARATQYRSETGWHEIIVDGWWVMAQCPNGATAQIRSRATVLGTGAWEEGTAGAGEVPYAQPLRAQVRDADGTPALSWRHWRRRVQCG